MEYISATPFLVLLAGRFEMSQELVETEFFGYTGGKFCAEIHAVSYNEFLSVIKMMKEKLVQVRNRICECMFASTVG